MNEAKSSCQRLSGSTLKWIACISMLIDHTAFLLIGYGVLNTVSPGTPAYHMWIQLYYIMRSIGRIAFPIYVFLLTEGIVHTKSWTRYGIRLGIFAVLSELPFDWMCVDQSSIGSIIAELMRTDYGYIGVILAVLLYLSRKDRKKQCILGFLWKSCHLGRISFLLGIAAAFLLIYAYSGKKGSSAGKYLYYGFYPAHILLLCILYQILFAGHFL